MLTHIYLTGVLISFLIVAITFLSKLRKIHKTNKVFPVSVGDLFFAAVCISASWSTVIVFLLMCLKTDLEHKIIRKF